MTETDPKADAGRISTEIVALDQRRDLALALAEHLMKCKSHKIVSAGRIAHVIALAAGGANLMVEAKGGIGPRRVGLTQDAVRRHMPVEGDWLMIYEDGYVSVSPAAAFVAGYTAI